MNPTLQAYTPVVSAKHLSKSFTFWTEQPNSLKTLLSRMLQFNVSFGQKKTLNIFEDINFEIFPGEFVGIMGKNGAGKSTLLRMISQIYYPSSGTLKTRGTIAPLIELGAGFHPELSGYENIFLNAAILGFGRDATKKALQSIIDFSELGPHIHREVRHYSSGMLVRLGFAIAAHLDADIYLIDEVLSVGDVSFRAKCINKIQSLHQKGKTIVFITHDDGSVKKYCSRAIVISDKKILFDGNPEKATQVYLEKMGT